MEKWTELKVEADYKAKKIEDGSHRKATRYRKGGFAEDVRQSSPDTRTSTQQVGSHGKPRKGQAKGERGRDRR